MVIMHMINYLKFGNFESVFQMHQSCTTDEAMISFKGRLCFKQLHER